MQWVAAGLATEVIKERARECSDREHEVGVDGYRQPSMEILIIAIGVVALVGFLARETFTTFLQPKCPACRSQIARGATACASCGRDVPTT